MGLTLKKSEMSEKLCLLQKCNIWLPIYKDRFCFFKIAVVTLNNHKNWLTKSFHLSQLNHKVLRNSYFVSYVEN